MPAGLFGITDETLNLVVNLVLLFLVVLWLALIAWTFFDARRRIEDPVLVAFATAASLFPFVGTIVYSILRPPEFLEDKHERELEIRASELRVRQPEEQACPNCEYPLEGTFLRCPRCRTRIKNPCPSCAEPVDPRWSVCPYCETTLRRAASGERRSTSGTRREPAERRSTSTQGQPSSVPRSQRPQRSERRKPERSSQKQRAAGDQPSRKAPAPTSEDGTQPAEADRQPRTQDRKERPPQRSGGRTSTRGRS